MPVLPLLLSLGTRRLELAVTVGSSTLLELRLGQHEVLSLERLRKRATVIQWDSLPTVGRVHLSLNSHYLARIALPGPCARHTMEANSNALPNLGVDSGVAAGTLFDGTCSLSHWPEFGPGR